MGGSLGGMAAGGGESSRGFRCFRCLAASGKILDKGNKGWQQGSCQGAAVKGEHSGLEMVGHWSHMRRALQSSLRLRDSDSLNS